MEREECTEVTGGQWASFRFDCLEATCDVRCLVKQTATKAILLGGFYGQATSFCFAAEHRTPQIYSKKGSRPSPPTGIKKAIETGSVAMALDVGVAESDVETLFKLKQKSLSVWKVYDAFETHMCPSIPGSRCPCFVSV